MPAASPICPSVKFRPDTGSVSLLAMLPTIVTSRPSRIQVIPRAITTSQCHRAHGNRSILAGILVSTAWVAASPLLTPRLLSVHPDVIPQNYVSGLRYERPQVLPVYADVHSICTLWFGVQVTAHEPSPSRVLSMLPRRTRGVMCLKRYVCVHFGPFFASGLANL